MSGRIGNFFLGLEPFSPSTSSRLFIVKDIVDDLDRVAPPLTDANEDGLLGRFLLSKIPLMARHSTKFATSSKNKIRVGSVILVFTNSAGTFLAAMSRSAADFCRHF